MADCHPLAVAVLCDGYAFDVLHHEVRPAFGCGARVEDPRDIRVVHHRQRLALFGEAGEYLAGVHAEFHDFEGYTPANRFALLGEVHGAHTAFADGPNDVITAEVVITGWSRRCIDGLGSGFICANRTIESALDQTLRTQSRGITGTQLRFAMGAIWHWTVV